MSHREGAEKCDDACHDGVMGPIYLASTTEPPPITILGGRSTSACVSAAPRPGCVTSESTDNHQVAVFVAMALGMAFIGWRIARGVRRQRAAFEQAHAARTATNPPDPAPSGSA